MKIRQIVEGIAIAAIACASAQADPFTLTNGGTTAMGNTGPVGTSGPVLLDTFTVPPAGGAPVDNLFRNDVFIDDGTGARKLTSLPVLASTATATSFDALFDGGTFQVNLAYDLEASGVLNETITINAISAVVLRVWDYTDFIVAGTRSADTATLTSPSQIIQTDAVVNLTASVTVTTPVPDAFEIGDFFTLASRIGAGTDLANLHRGGNAFAFQWNFTLAAGETVGVVKTRSVSADATGCACEFGGDAGSVDVQDLLEFLALWLVNDAGADLDGGGVSITDLLEFLTCWFPASVGTCP